MKYITPQWPAPKKIKALTTTRRLWGEEAASEDQLQTLLHLPDHPIWLNQIHSNVVVEADLQNKGKDADASYSSKPNKICAVLTADCLPILLCNKQGTQVAAIHAGWRGLSGGIIEATVTALNQPQDEILVWLGPAIGPSKFEVGRDVYQSFIHQHQESHAAFMPYTKDKWLANLYDLAKIRLHLLGISQIFGGDFCTHTQDTLFFSYRRDCGKTGRMASLIWIEPRI